jgi:hypothetical protein
MGTVAIAVSLLSPLVLRASALPLTPLESQLLSANGSKAILNTEIAPAWSTTSNIRSTGNLLWTCVLTLSICVYTVIHLNVPPPNETQWQHFRRKTKWVAISILAPELALAAAWQQWSLARALKRELNRLYRNNYKKNNDGTFLTEKFGMTYCFYVVMGGFVMDSSAVNTTFEFPALQPSGIVRLAEKGHFIDIPEKAIKDKSKADILAKSLACLQVSWMIIQCIGRKVAGLPISLLEIHVLIHVACALCLYALWIDVLLPTIAFDLETLTNRYSEASRHSRPNHRGLV